MIGILSGPAKPKRPIENFRTVKIRSHARVRSQFISTETQALLPPEMQKTYSYEPVSFPKPQIVFLKKLMCERVCAGAIVLVRKKRSRRAGSHRCAHGACGRGLTSLALGTRTTAANNLRGTLCV